MHDSFLCYPSPDTVRRKKHNESAMDEKVPSPRYMLMRMAITEPKLRYEFKIGALEGALSSCFPKLKTSLFNGAGSLISGGIIRVRLISSL